MRLTHAGPSRVMKGLGSCPGQGKDLHLTAMRLSFLLSAYFLLILFLFRLHSNLFGRENPLGEETRIAKVF